MGADLILMAVPLFRVTTARKRELREFLAVIPNEYILEFAENHLFLDGAEGETDSEVASNVRSTLYNDVLASIECDGRRDVCSLKLPGMNYEVLITGGLSWGDSPTDSCDVLQHVDAHWELWQLLMRFSIEDAENDSTQQESEGD